MVMKLSTLTYLIKQGFVNLYKNRLMSLASIGTIAACIMVIGIFFSVVSNIEHMIHEIQHNIGVVLFFEESTSEQRILEIKDTLEQRDEVFKVTYISAEKAWEEFKKDYFRGREELLAGYEDKNPLEDSASLQIYLKDITKQEQLVSSIEQLEDIRYVREEREITYVFEGINDFVKYLSVVLIMILIVVSVFLISNTVRLGIELRKREINIMKYIGATDTFIRGPFIVEGAGIGLIGALIPLGIIANFYDEAIQKIINEFTILNNYLQFLTVNEILVSLVPLSIVIGIGIGVVGSMLTIHKHLKV